MGNDCIHICTYPVYYLNCAAHINGIYLHMTGSWDSERKQMGAQIDSGIYRLVEKVPIGVLPEEILFI